MCDKNKVRYFSSIITNGYLLTKDVMVKLIKCRIKNIQITLDGPERYHDNRRYLVGHRPTFNRILSNLKDFAGISKNEGFPFISIRMNVDKHNINGVKELKDLLTLSPFNEYVYFYIAAVYDKADINNQYTYTPSEFDKINKEFKKEIEVDYKQFYPSPIAAHCVCDSLTGFVIDSDGSLYKCWEEMGDLRNCIGNIKDFDFMPSKQLYYDYLMYDPTNNKDCKECSVLPICMGGGCPHRIIKDGYTPNCENVKNSIYKNIVTSYKMLKTK